jgi:hypothetical protein
MNMKSVVLLVTVALIAGLLGCGASSVPAPSGSATRAPGAETKASQAPLTPVTVVDAKVEGAAQEAPPKSPGASAATASDQPAATNEERPEEQLPEVVAKVGDEVISGKELKRQTTFITRMRGKPDDSSLPLLHRRILDNLINERVLTVLARNANVTVSDEEVKVEFEKSKSRMPSEEYFQQYLRDQDLTQDELMGLIRDSLIKRK